MAYIYVTMDLRLVIKRSLEVGIVNKKTIEIYQDKYGFEPYIEWVDSLTDWKTKARIEQRIRRIEQGNLGDFKSVGDGVFELRFDFGSGYRVYFGQEKEKLIILLIGGDKSTQKKDIVLAKTYWQEYQGVKNEKA
jgi:putative addiction module killer protein